MKDIRVGQEVRTVPEVQRATPGQNRPAGRSFGKVLQESIQEVNRLQVEADSAIDELAIGQTGSVHETMIAVEKADTSFRLMMQVRNKIIDAYHEIMRMQI